MFINPYLAIFIVLITIFIFYCHCYQFLKTNSDYEILQMDNPEKSVYEKKMLLKSPTFIMNVIHHWKGINQINQDYIEVSPDFLKDKVVKKTLDKFASFYDLPFSISRKYESLVLKKGQTTPLVKINDHRLLWAQIYGKLKIAIFSPKNAKYLYPSKKDKKVSQIDHWKLSQENENQEFPDYSEANYIEIILSPGQIFYLPAHWWMTIECLEDSMSIKIKSNSIFSLMF